MKALVRILLLFVAFLTAVSCVREQLENEHWSLPEGTPVTLLLGFGSDELSPIQVGTKATSNRADEQRIHDLYVMFFDSAGNRFYNRYFSYEHLVSNRSDLLAQNNEGWFVDNVTLTDLANNATKNKQTRGVVKISTQAKSGCTLILLANVKNAVMNLKGADDPIDFLDDDSNAGTLELFRKIRVKLTQDATSRNDLFLMLGKNETAWNTGEMAWDYENTGDYTDDYNISLKPLDAKVKFRIKYNSNKINSINPRLWRVYNVPSEAYLDPDATSDPDESFFDTVDLYFDGTETDDSGTWQVFSFYMLQNRQAAKLSVNTDDEIANCDAPKGSYHRREFQRKEVVDTDVFENKEWVFAPEKGTYVKFDVILYLTSDGIDAIAENIAEALTTDAIFTVHLGDFSNNSPDDYNTLRGTSYTYNVTIDNSKYIYVEVMGDNTGIQKEIQPGQEGSLLLTTAGIINCDAHYEYHSMEFEYNAKLGGSEGTTDYENRQLFSWYIKTPFNPDGYKPQFSNGWYIIPEGDKCDFGWVKFMLNDRDNNDLYVTYRQQYPGEFDIANNKANYDPEWTPQKSIANSSVPIPKLMDINQLVNFLFWQNEKKFKNEADNLFDDNGKIRVTAFVDEFYYEKHPLTGEVDPNLWRTFVNALPRELHILSDANRSKDQQSNVITSSHSIIQQSIQTIYNIYSPTLTSLWGTEHNDQLHKGAEEPSVSGDGWPWWPTGQSLPNGFTAYNDQENGRLNTSAIWGVSDSCSPAWSEYLDFKVNNDMPELRNEYQFLAYACMSRNRDNNGNGTIEPDEIRWYTAAINQLVGLWVGNESLTQTARLYLPRDASNSDPVNWRAEVDSSTGSMDNPMVIRAEEGGTKSFYDQWYFWQKGRPETDHYKVTSVRCLRNIGTYREKGVQTDISYAPLDRMVDQYYECESGFDSNGRAWPEQDGTYSIRFPHLNSKCIREYTSEDLPFHDEYSEHNRVYLRFIAQDPTIHASGANDGQITAKPDDINFNITRHNDYCPPGYRLPNMTELVLMSTLLPDSYWTMVSGNTNYPCRSYYTRGKLGIKTSGEDQKVGWGYTLQTGNWRVHLINSADTKMGFRCVKDDVSMIGDITGGITVKDGDCLSLDSSGNLKMNIELDFDSLGSAIDEVKLELWYTDPSGVRKTKDIYKGGRIYAISTFSPSIQDEFICNPISGIPVYGNMSVHAYVKNSYGTLREFDTPIHILSELKLSIRLLPCQYDESVINPSFPVLATAYNVDAEKIKSWRLIITPPAGSVSSVTLDSFGDASTTYYTSKITYYNPSSLSTGTYSFQLEAVDKDDNITRSEKVSMDVLKVNYSLNGNPWSRQMIKGLDFGSGDFIEANMGVSDCTYSDDDGVAGVSEGDTGKDNIFSFGLSDIGKTANTFHIEYPAVDAGGNYWLNFKPRWTDGSGGFTYSVIVKEKPLHIRLEKNGIYWNGQRMDVSRWGLDRRPNVRAVMDKLTTANTIYIGAEGAGESSPHLSRATYRFVRVVYNGRDTNIHGGDSNFNENPVYGGNL